MVGWSRVLHGHLHSALRELHCSDCPGAMLQSCPAGGLVYLGIVRPVGRHSEYLTALLLATTELTSLYLESWRKIHNAVVDTVVKHNGCMRAVDIQQCRGWRGQYRMIGFELQTSKNAARYRSTRLMILNSVS
jgi:hypothetical protein